MAQGTGLDAVMFSKPQDSNEFILVKLQINPTGVAQVRASVGDKVTIIPLRELVEEAMAEVAKAAQWAVDGASLRA